MKKILMILFILVLLSACSTQARFQTEPYSYVVSTPLFGSLGNFDIYAEMGFAIPEAEGVDVLSGTITGSIINQSTLTMQVKIYIITQGTSDLNGAVQITRYEPLYLDTSSEYTLSDITIGVGEKVPILISADSKPIIKQAVSGGKFWIIAHGAIAGISIAPQILINDMIIDVTVEKDMGSFFPFVDLM